MQTFNKKFTVGTKVKIEGISDFVTVTAIHESRKWINVAEYEGAFQRGHVEKFSNKTATKIN